MSLGGNILFTNVGSVIYTAGLVDFITFPFGPINRYWTKKYNHNLFVLVAETNITLFSVIHNFASAPTCTTSEGVCLQTILLPYTITFRSVISEQNHQ